MLCCVLRRSWFYEVWANDPPCYWIGRRRGFWIDRGNHVATDGNKQWANRWRRSRTLYRARLLLQQRWGIAGSGRRDLDDRRSEKIALAIATLARRRVNSKLQ